MFAQILRLFIWVILALSVGCDSSDDGYGGGVERGQDQPTDPSGALFVVHTANAESFIVEITDPEQIESARDQLRGEEPFKGVMGQVVAGNPGFNRDELRGVTYSWHLDPESVQFFEVAIEICDGIPSFVESNLEEWEQRQFCPWSSQVSREL